MYVVSYCKVSEELTTPWWLDGYLDPIIGLLRHTRRRDNQFMLTICDYVTRYPEALAITNVEVIHRADISLCHHVISENMFCFY